MGDFSSSSISIKRLAKEIKNGKNPSGLWVLYGENVISDIYIHSEYNSNRKRGTLVCGTPQDPKYIDLGCYSDDATSFEQVCRGVVFKITGSNEEAKKVAGLCDLIAFIGQELPSTKINELSGCVDEEVTP